MTPDDRRAHLARAAELVPDGARRGREYCVALAKITDEYRGAQASSEIGGDHNALK